MSNESEINKFLNEDEPKIKEAIDHIQSELAKCTRDKAADQKGTFKKVVEGALQAGLDHFKSSADSTSIRLSKEFKMQI
nr:Mlp family lipoprotein [Borrelia duttonii]